MRQLFISCAIMLLGCDAESDSFRVERDASSQDTDHANATKDAGATADARQPASSSEDDAPGPTTGNVGESDAAAENTCDAVNIQARPLSPEILIVLDRSGSMVGVGDPRNQGKNRWVPSTSAVKDLTSALQESVSFGLMLFPAPGRGNNCAPGKVDVPVALNSARAIASRLDMSTPDTGSTPTAGTLENAYGVLSRVECADCVTGPKFVLLVTDGQPNCGAMGTETTPADIAASNAALDKLREAEIKTYVIGYDMASDATSADIMQQFAQHGGTEKFIPVENEDELTAELRRITGSLVSCEYELNEDVADPMLVRVRIDGEEHVLGQGWRLEGRKVILEGACDKIRDARVHHVEIRKECTPVIFG